MVRIPQKLLFLLLLIGSAVAMSACSGGPIEPAQASTNRNQQQQQSTPTPTPTPTPLADIEVEPTPTPTSGPLVSRADAEGVVLEAVTDCATGVAGGEGEDDELVVGVRLFFDSEFSSVSRAWVITVSSADFTVTFGRWQVREGSLLQAIPDDRIAEKIADSGQVCVFPAVLLEADPAPPRFVTPTGEHRLAASGQLFSTPEQAAMRVWSSDVYDCFHDFPLLTSFTGYDSPDGNYLVEGRTEQTFYGLWQVDAVTGEITPVDAVARKVDSETCNAIPVTLSADQAAIRVWVATYDCLDQPPLDVFTASQESPHRWVVEGRTTSTDPDTGDEIEKLLGLWQVAADTGNITALDAEADKHVGKACFNRFI